MNYKEFFHYWHDVTLSSTLTHDVNFEELYQAFKARLIDEVKTNVQSVYKQADLVEKE